MKSIGNFLEGKIRRSEVDGPYRVEHIGENDPEYGPFEGALISDRGRSDFFQNGIVFSDGRRLPYAILFKVFVDSEPNQDKLIHVIGMNGEKIRIRCSADGGTLVYAALRWIGHTRLRRTIAK